MAHAKEPLTRGTSKGGSELTDRGRTKLRGQIARAERIMRVEGERNSTGEVYRTAAQMKRRAQKLLGVTESSPGKAPSKSDVHAKRRKPVEKATGTDRTKRFLQEVAKKAERASRGE